MKILFIIDCLASGGKERRLIELMKMLKLRDGIEFELVIMRADIHYKEVLDLGIKINFVIRKTKKDITVFLKLFRICKQLSPDIVHCWDDMTAVYVSPVCKILNIKLVNGMIVDTPVHFNIFNKSWLRAKLTFPLSDLIIGNSYAGLKAYHAPLNKSVCIHNGMHLSRFDMLRNHESVVNEIFRNNQDSIFIIGMVAAFEERKDYETLVKAALILVSLYEDIRFVFVGEGSNLRKVKNLVPIEVINKLLFLGKRSDVESIVNIFDVAVLLTNSKVHGEGISNSILEYMALGKPVIASRGGGTNELVSDNINGYLIDPGNRDQFIDKIKLLKVDSQLRKRLGENGKKLISERFEISVMTQKYVNQYNILVNKN